MIQQQRYKIIIAYNGSNFCGWQVQKNGATISSTLEDTFKTVFGSSIKLVGASRTDAGVHALGQVAVFSTDKIIPKQNLLTAWNNALHEQITIQEIEQISSQFHPQYDVKQKTYWYHIFTKRPTPFFKPFGVYVDHEINIERLQQALQLFEGTHDFRSFCSNKDDRCTIRTIDSISLEYHKEIDSYRITVKGKGFLHHMIRRIVGATLHIATYPQVSLNTIHHALAHPNAQQTLPNAPAQGLTLAHIAYKETKDG